jgi:hypothetical protein
MKKLGTLREQIKPIMELETLIEEAGVFMELAGEDESEIDEAVVELGPILEEITEKLE